MGFRSFGVSGFWISGCKDFGKRGFGVNPSTTIPQNPYTQKSNLKLTINLYLII